MAESSEIYAAQLAAVQAQNARIYGPPPTGDPWGGASARQFRFDPLRVMDGNLAVIASYVSADDVVVDVGGGAGRVCLLLSRNCREVINVEPSPGMGAEFQSSADEAGITNARLVSSSLANADGPKGDIVFTADVTYFVSDVVAFVRQMEAAAARRLMITIWSEPPPNRGANLFQLIYGEEQNIFPGQAQLLPVLWDLGILPDVLVMPESPWWENQRPPTREAAIEMVLEDRVVKPQDRDWAQPLIESRFDELFAVSVAGFVPQWRSDMREILITWEPES